MNLYKKMKPYLYFLYVGIIGLGILIDQITKMIAVEYLKPVYDMPLWEGVFHFTYHENSGMAFSMLSGSDERWIFITVSIIAIIGLGAYLFLGHVENRLSGASIALIVSGGLGNMIDRLSERATVIDFLNFELIDFAIFNVADSFVCVGAGLLILSLVLEIISDSKKNKVEHKND